MTKIDDSRVAMEFRVITHVTYEIIIFTNGWSTSLEPVSYFNIYPDASKPSRFTVDPLLFYRPHTQNIGLVKGKHKLFYGALVYIGTAYIRTRPIPERPTLVSFEMDPHGYRTATVRGTAYPTVANIILWQPVFWLYIGSRYSRFCKKGPRRIYDFKISNMQVRAVYSTFQNCKK